jgi:hypothetical protein
MTKAYKGEIETDNGHRLFIEKVVAIAIIESGTSKNEGSFLRVSPIRMESAIKNNKQPFPELQCELKKTETVVDVIPMNGVWSVYWDPKNWDEYEITHLGYEIEGATNQNWDHVIENQVKEGEFV